MPQMEHLAKLVKYFGVSYDSLLGEGEASAPMQNELKFALFGNAEIDDDLFEEVKRFAKFAYQNKKNDAR
jgi:hypothetical protein